MLTISVAEYAKNPAFHQMQGKTEVPKPTIFKQIKENRLPSNVEAEEIGGRYIMRIYEPGELCELVVPDKKKPDGFDIITSGLRKDLTPLCEKLVLYSGKPFEVREKQNV